MKNKWKCLNCEDEENKIGNDKEDEDYVLSCKSCFIRCYSEYEIELIDARYYAEDCADIRDDYDMKYRKCVHHHQDAEDDRDAENGGVSEEKIVKCKCQTKCSISNFANTQNECYLEKIDFPF